MTSDTTRHQHAAYSARDGIIRCSCGARRDREISEYRDAGGSITFGWVWVDDGLRACAACARPTSDTGSPPLCDWHRTISA